jgi:hypothetical protein
MGSGNACMDIERLLFYLVDRQLDEYISAVVVIAVFGVNV